MKIYNRGILVAVSDKVNKEEKPIKVPFLRLLKDTQPDLIPLDLFGVGKYRVDKILMSDVYNKWLYSRIFPEDRDDLLEMLERDYGIIGYGEEQKKQLLRITKGALAHDDITIEFED